MANGDNRTASQRIQDLENGAGQLFQTMNQVSRDSMLMRDAVKLLGNKLDAVVRALRTTVNEQLTDDLISKLMMENNVEELKSKVTDLVNRGILKTTETLDDNTFVVGAEVDDKDVVVNPRLQFALSGIPEDMRNKIKAGKIGEKLVLQEGKLKFELQEAYAIQAPPPPTEAPAQTVDAQTTGDADAQAPAEAPAAPAETQSSSDAAPATTPATES